MRGGLSDRLLSVYTAAFLIFMFAPLILMVVASFNDISPSSVTDWRGTTGKWYAFFWMPVEELRADPVLRALDRGRFIGCIQYSLIVALAVLGILASALANGAALLTADQRILDWPGKLVRHDART